MCSLPGRPVTHLGGRSEGQCFQELGHTGEAGPALTAAPPLGTGCGRGRGNGGVEASNSLLPSFPDHGDPLTVFSPRNVLDFPGKRLVLILQEVFLLCGIPDPQFPRDIWGHSRGRVSHTSLSSTSGFSSLLEAVCAWPRHQLVLTQATTCTPYPVWVSKEVQTTQ